MPAGRVGGSRKKVHRQYLMEFIEHSLHYFFPGDRGVWSLVLQLTIPIHFKKTGIDIIRVGRASEFIEALKQSKKIIL